ncbi:unnamed protein product [Haemonchus placei]|uniref:Oxidoreductase n=1 Tax=Haemonchus placei TaxID=6290 RepID=A0A0N4WMT0_HAEPC|nr:unnamed protein product [Haemonchus placei]
MLTRASLDFFNFTGIAKSMKWVPRFLPLIERRNMITVRPSTSRPAVATSDISPS